jgi:flap endonuclease-1
LKRYAPRSIRVLPRDALKYKRFSIDASQIVHKYVRAILKSGIKMKIKRGEFTAHVMAVLSKTQFYLRLRLFPIYVFDGTSGTLKAETLDERRVLREASSGAAGQFKLTDWMVADIKRLLDLMRIPWKQATGEADPQCARLTRRPNKIAYGVVSDDGDMLTYGATRLVRELDSRSNAVTIVQLKDVLSELEMSMEQFVELCILLGSDYCPTIRGVGPVAALKLIREEESVRSWAERTKQDPEWIARFESTKRLFLKSRTSDPSTIRATWRHPDLEGLESYLRDMRFGNPEERARQLGAAYNEWRAEASDTAKRDHSESVEMSDHRHHSRSSKGTTSSSSRLEHNGKRRVSGGTAAKRTQSRNSKKAGG